MTDTERPASRGAPRAGRGDEKQRGSGSHSQSNTPTRPAQDSRRQLTIVAGQISGRVPFHIAVAFSKLGVNNRADLLEIHNICGGQPTSRINTIDDVSVDVLRYVRGLIDEEYAFTPSLKTIRAALQQQPFWTLQDDK
jgi:hypothetical protein